MADVELSPELAKWAEHFEKLEWSACVLDPDFKLVWISPELRGFMPPASDTELGLGQHIFVALTQSAWLSTVDPDSQRRIFLDVAPYIVGEMHAKGQAPEDLLPDAFVSLLDEIEPQPMPRMTSTWFNYITPSDDPDLPTYRVNACFMGFRDDDGKFLGATGLFFAGVRPNLLTLLSRGNEDMYERMARLVDPRTREAAVLFCDLHQSGKLSRQLSSARYFRLVRKLWMGIDHAVAANKGIVGKHAGDGASAFFLGEDLGSPSQAAVAAIRTARAIHEVSEGVFAEVLDSECLMKVGLHWGGNLYMGQLVPGGRLDVTALGDEVNEAARIQESAQAGGTLVGKQLIEHLDPDDASALGIDAEKLRYRTISEIDEASEKAKVDAGNISVTTV